MFMIKYKMYRRSLKYIIEQKEVLNLYELWNIIGNL